MYHETLTDTETYRGFDIEIHIDQSPENPRNWGC